MAVGYAAIVTICVTVMVKMSTRAQTRNRAYWCFALVAAYCVVSMWLWLDVLRHLGIQDVILIPALALSLLTAIIVGIAPTQEPDGSQRRRLWSTAARARRAYRNLTGAAQ